MGTLKQVVEIMKKKILAPVKLNPIEQQPYTPSKDSKTLEEFYLPILKLDSPQPGTVAPIHLLGVAGGVGTTTIATIANEPDKLLDFAQLDSRRQFVSYLPRVILVTNLTYSSVIHLQAIMQQWTDKQQFQAAGYEPQILGVVVNDNTNCKATPATKKLLDYVLSGVQHRWDFPFVPTLQDNLDPEEAALSNSFYKKTKEMVALAAN